jgi:aminomethyltransferase
MARLMNEAPHLKRTPLFERHGQLGGRLVEFSGWEMPVQYTGIADEHKTVRSAAGLFDISHMGQIQVSGPRSLEGLNRVLTNDLARLEVGQGQYTLMCNEEGGVIDDLYIYRVEAEAFLLIVNASRVRQDLAWLRAQLESMGSEREAQVADVSAAKGAVALQGPAARGFIGRCFPGASFPQGIAPGELKKNQILSFRWERETIFLACTGYTGEDGFEIMAPAGMIPAIWDAILREGKAQGVKPSGLGARDTLRTEMCYPLYGHELTEERSPLEAGLDRFVDLTKASLIGERALAAQKERGPSQVLAAFVMLGKTPPPRPHYPILGEEQSQPIGEVTSGTQSPSLERGIGMGYVPPAFGAPGGRLQIQIRGALFPAEVVRKPFYRRNRTQ